MEYEEKRMVLARLRYFERPVPFGGVWDGTVMVADEFGISVQEVLEIKEELEDEGV